MNNGIFITATGTDIGKTFITSALLFQMNRAAIPVNAIKPVVSGFKNGDPDSDPAKLLRAMGRPHHLSAIEDITPWRYEAPLAANFAADREGKTVPWQAIINFCTRKLAEPNITLVEGAGGLMSPVTDTRLVIDLIKELNIPALLVSANYLGSISHTLTALQSLASYDIPVIGIAISESEEGSVTEHQLRQLIFNRQLGHIPLVWIPRNSHKSDAYKFTPNLEPLWMNHPSFIKN